MSESSKPEAKADELTKATDKTDTELTAEELDNVSGGITSHAVGGGSQGTGG